MLRKNGNGDSKGADIFHGKKVKYPVSFEMKSVMDFNDNDARNKANLEKVFMDQQVVFRFVSQKVSSKGSYMSYTYHVTIVSKGQMEKMYLALKSVEGLKFAL
jgi:putative lipoic acid-binding regulatory protein